MGEASETMVSGEGEVPKPQPSPEAKVVFSEGALRRQVVVDAAMRVAALAAAIVGVAMVIGREGAADAVVSAAVLVVLVVWMALNSISARVSRDLPRLTALLDQDHRAAEAMIAEMLRRRPLLRWVRLMIYHRLAVLRHREARYAESAAICQAVVSYPMGPARQVRPHLLLMLAEARMQLGQPALAWAPLAELHGMELGLMERLQRLALRTRYEVMIGRPDAALRQAAHKVQMAELMPAAQCGAMHALLATAAERAEQTDYARWLWARARLLLTPGQIEHLEQGKFGMVEAE